MFIPALEGNSQVSVSSSSMLHDQWVCDVCVCALVCVCVNVSEDNAALSTDACVTSVCSGCTE